VTILGQATGAGQTLISADRLRSIAFWSRELSDDEIERACKGIVEKTFAKGAYVSHRGDTLDAWMGVVSGLLKIGTISSSGKGVMLAGLPAGMWFGEGTLLKGEARLYDIFVLRESCVAMMNRATFMWLFDNSVGFNRFLVRQFNERVGQFIALVEHDRMLDGTARIARCIAWLFNPTLNPNIGPVLEISQEELGQLAGLSRQVTNKALKTLEDEGLVVVLQDGVRAMKLAKLSRYGE
jgi:CRP/FNR family transcriptional regulator, cyclic AMP receptor protein